MSDIKSDNDSLYFDGKIQDSDVLINFDFKKEGRKFEPSEFSVDIEGYGAKIEFNNFKDFIGEYQLIAYFEPQKIMSAWGSMDKKPQKAERFFEGISGVDDFSAWDPSGKVV